MQVLNKSQNEINNVIEQNFKKDPEGLNLESKKDITTNSHDKTD